MDIFQMQHLLQLIKDGRVHYTIREGGNELYRQNRLNIQYLLGRNLIKEVKETCCTSSFKLTKLGEAFLHESSN